MRTLPLLFLASVIFLIFTNVSLVGEAAFAAEEREVTYYGVDTVEAKDLATVSQYGINTVRANLGVGAEESWVEFFRQADMYDIKVIVWPLGDGHCGFPWVKATDGSWDVSVVYPMLDYLSAQENFLALNIAHEPFNRDTPQCMLSIEEMMEIRGKVKAYVRGKYDKEIKIANYLNSYNDKMGGHIADLAIIWLHCIENAEAPCLDALDQAKIAREAIDNRGWDHMELLFTFQAFAMPPNYPRMPTAEEMEEWGCALAQSGDLDAFFWYGWGKDTPNYTESLAESRYDSEQGDRWEAMKYVYDHCIGGEEPPEPPDDSITLHRGFNKILWSSDYQVDLTAATATNSINDTCGENSTKIVARKKGNVFSDYIPGYGGDDFTFMADHHYWIRVLFPGDEDVCEWTP